MSDAAEAAVLADLAAARRARRLEGVDVFERLYQAYLTVVVVGAVVLAAAGVVTDVPLAGAARSGALDAAPAAVGIVAAFVLVGGLRSGARGGPLTLEAPFVVHVLLSPVARDVALRGPALRLLAQATAVGGVAGGGAGMVAAPRLDLDTAVLTASGAVAGAAAGVAAVGLALVVSAWPVPRLLAHAVSALVVAGAVADLALGTAWSPGSLVGRLALAPFAGPDGSSGFDLVSLTALVLALVTGGVGLAVVGGTPVEAARRRAGLVSQLRFAVTRQDLRTVVLLQRRLAQDAARRRPWVRIPAGHHLPVLRRGLHGLARLPLVRVVRVVAACAVAVGAAVATWQGTTLLVVVAGIALWVAALDLVEPMAQELDHPDRWATQPVPPGRLLVRHLAAPMVVLGLVAAVVLAALALTARGETATVVAVGTAVAVPACLAAVVGAAASVATAPFELTSVKAFVPEAIGAQMVLRAVWPPAVAVLAVLPLLAARGAVGQGLPPLDAAASAFGWAPAVLAAVFAAGGWLDRRAPVPA